MARRGATEPSVRRRSLQQSVSRGPLNLAASRKHLPPPVGVSEGSPSEHPKGPLSTIRPTMQHLAPCAASWWPESLNRRVAVHRSGSSAQDEEFVAFVDAAMPRLRRTAFLIVGDWQHAEDVTQTVLLNLYRRWPRVRSSASPWGYAHAAVVNAAITELRRPYRRERPVDPMPERGRTDPAWLVDDTVTAALMKLGPQQRAVVVLRYIEDLDIACTAAVLEISEGTVKSQAARGLATLRRLLIPKGSSPTATLPVAAQTGEDHVDP